LLDGSATKGGVHATSAGSRPSCARMEHISLAITKE
jgi:hypothetical protein